MSETREYRVWASMIDRCRNPNNSHWKSYGGRGIRVCERWQSFENFYEDMKPFPPGLTLDRIDVHGHYEPGNVRWLPRRLQSRNTTRNVWCELNGERVCLAEYMERTGSTEYAARKKFGLKWWKP